MEYHNNTVNLRAQNFSIKSGTFTITGLSITEGQDPQGRNQVGKTLEVDASGNLTFEVGRKHSEGVAQWFNDRVPPTRNTFAHEAGDLNFAFIGNLSLVVEMNDSPGTASTLTFEGVAFAQGSVAGGRNNWWFGGTASEFVGDSKVFLWSDAGPGKQTPILYGRRGGNDGSKVNVVDVTIEHRVKLDTSRWMSHLGDSLTFNQLMVPGSHDAGMSPPLTHCSVGAGQGNTQTQGIHIGAQLGAGSRYFDLRVDYDHDELITYHRSDVVGTGWGCSGQPLANVLDEGVAFLQKNPSETMIFKFTFRDGSGHNKLDIATRTQKLLEEKYSTSMYCASAATNVASVALGELRGKFVVAFNNQYVGEPKDGILRYCDYVEGGSGANGKNLAVFDQYSDTGNYQDMCDDQVKKWKQHANTNQGYLFLLSWTLTGGNIGDNTQVAHAGLGGVLKEQIIDKGAIKPNIVYLDFINSAIGSMVIQYNF